MSLPKLHAPEFSDPFYIATYPSSAQGSIEFEPLVKFKNEHEIHVTAIDLTSKYYEIKFSVQSLFIHNLYSIIYC